MLGRGSRRARAALGGGAAAVVAVLLGWAVVYAAPATGAQLIRDNLYGTKVVSKSDAWVVGAFGTVFRTRDGGGSWQRQVTHTAQQLYDVDFADERRGWIVGRSGLILHTSDGGDTWLPQDSKVDRHLFGVDFADERFGWVVGDWGVILVTRNGGRDWEVRSLPEDVILNDLSMVSRSKGWIAGERGTILMTEDGGTTWVKQESGVEKTLFGIYFADALRGWAVGIDGLILHTEDGGAAWTVQNGLTELRQLEQVGFVQAFDNPSLYAVAVEGALGVVVGEIGAILVSSDGGHTWARQKALHEWGLPWFRAVSVVPGAHGLIVGAKGRRVIIVDGRLDLPAGGSGVTEAVH